MPSHPTNVNTAFDVSLRTRLPQPTYKVLAQLAREHECTVAEVAAVVLAKATRTEVSR